jgi:RNA polymerase sigma-70 factor (ECF subfamily)
LDAVVLQRNYLNRLLETLPERDRHLLLLREVEGLSITELAEATGLNENVLKIRLFRARQRLVRAAALLPYRKTRGAGSDRKQP